MRGRGDLLTYSFVIFAFREKTTREEGFDKFNAEVASIILIGVEQKAFKRQ